MMSSNTVSTELTYMKRQRLICLLQPFLTIVLNNGGWRVSHKTPLCVQRRFIAFPVAEVIDAFRSP